MPDSNGQPLRSLRRNVSKRSKRGQSEQDVPPLQPSQAVFKNIISKSIWGIQRWADSLDRVDFFFDLHAHPSKKGFFIYGNAFEEFIEQI